MNSPIELDIVAELYARVYDQAFETDAFRSFTNSILDSSPSAEVQKHLDSLSFEVAKLLIDDIQKSEFFDLVSNQEAHDDWVSIDIRDVTKSAKSAAAKSEIIERFQNKVAIVSGDTIRVYSSNIGLDGIFICKVGAGSGLAIECKDLFIPFIEGDESKNVQTNTTLFGVLDFASKRAVPKWLEHLSNPKTEGLSSFLVYDSPHDERLQVKFIRNGRYFAILSSSANEEELKRIESIDLATRTVLDWLERF